MAINLQQWDFAFRMGVLGVQLPQTTVALDMHRFDVDLVFLAIKRSKLRMPVERLEVSRRTLYRDIEALRNAGARIEGEAGVGYTLVEDIAMPPQTLTRLETEALAIGLAEVQFRGDALLATAARDAMAKITATLQEDQQRDVLHAVSQVYRFTTHEPLTVDIIEIREACWDERALCIAYEDRKGAVTHRRIFPLAVLYFEYAVMLLAYSHLRNGYRTFHVTHIKNVQPLEESFRPRRVRLLNDFVADLRRRLGERVEDLTLR